MKMPPKYKQLHLVGFLFFMAIIRPITVGAVISKCCPVDSQIRIGRGSLPNCVKRENSSAAWDSYNVQVSADETQFPQCNYGVQPIVQASTNFSTVNGCFDRSNDGSLYSISCKGQPAIALHKLSKCCPLKHSYERGRGVCVPSNSSQSVFRKLFGDYVVVVEWRVPKCTTNEEFVEFQSMATNVAFVNHHLRVKSEYFPGGEALRTDKYCIESVDNTTRRQNDAHIMVWSCQPKNISDQMPFVIKRCTKNDEFTVERGSATCRNDEKLGKLDFFTVSMLTSCVFLLLTLIVYLSLPKLLNLHGKTLVCYVFTVFCAFCILVVTHTYSYNLPTYCCFGIALLWIFWILSAFCWQTVISVDLWLGFRSFEAPALTQKQSFRRFTYYVMYGWGAPLMWITFVFLVAEFEFVPADWVPRLDGPPCYLQRLRHWHVYYLYAFGPVFSQLTLSITIFIVASVYCIRVQRKIHQIHFKPSKRKEFVALKAVYTTKLQIIIVMGISWTLELINLYYYNESLKILIELYNILRGFMVFYIIVYKRPVIHEFKRRIGCGAKTKPSANTSSTDTLDMKDESSLNGRSASARTNAVDSESISSID